jgi:hypothetical protein
MYRFHASLVAKATAAFLPVAQMVLLRFSGIDKSTVGFMVLADAISPYHYHPFVLFTPN